MEKIVLNEQTMVEHTAPISLQEAEENYKLVAEFGAIKITKCLLAMGGA